MGPFEVIVIGLGASGSAAVSQLAQRGRDVLGLDRHVPPHTHGSSHGGSRIIRTLYADGATYLPLIRRSYALWRELEALSGRDLLRTTGGLVIGPPDSEMVAGPKASAETHDLEHEVLSADSVHERFPAFRVPDGQIGLWEPEAGVLDPEACIRAHLAGAENHGATLHVDEPARDWAPSGGGVQVSTPQHLYHADRLVVCPGGWTHDFFPGLNLPLEVERQVNGWFRPRANPGHFAPSHCPILRWEYRPGHSLYGFPDFGDGVKAGLHHDGECAEHPDELLHTATEDDAAALRRPLRRLLPDVDGSLAQMRTCFYTNMPDHDYLIDEHPEFPQVVFASAGSGHGFKTASAIGEILADLVTKGRTSLDIEAFRLKRRTPG